MINFDRIGVTMSILICLEWYVWFGRFRLVGLFLNVGCKVGIGRFGLVVLVWFIWFGRVGLVCCFGWFGRFGLVGLVW